MADDGLTERKRPGSFSVLVPAGDTRAREVCETCGFINYVNPKIVTGAVVQSNDGRILMCRRAIEPRRGFWTIPAGFLEEQETIEAAALREAREEASAEIALEALLAVYSIPRLSQVQLIYKARLTHPAIAPGPESLEVALLEFAAIPWDALAFPSVHWALRQFALVRDRKVFTPFTNPEGEAGDMTQQAPHGL
jgi:ADP-ribose pyrophosphatase YjhB (NUDIX family)